MARTPDDQLAARVLPEPLYRALRHVFAQGIVDCTLVGGTALAGYYAGHRRSDDLDLFVRDAAAQRACVLAVESLRELDAVITPRQRTLQFFDASCELDAHAFTVQVVIDARLFEVGSSATAGDGVVVADLHTLLEQKASTLVSRCSEKDLYDLEWLFGEFPKLELGELIELGAEIDAGMTAEAVLLSLTGTAPREEACDFSYSQDRAEVLRQVTDLRQTLAQGLEALARKQAVSPLAELVRALRPRKP